jgi:hypothetical protein
MHKYSDNCLLCKIYSSANTFELTPEEKIELEESDKELEKEITERKNKLTKSELKELLQIE